MCKLTQLSVLNILSSTGSRSSWSWRASRRNASGSSTNSTTSSRRSMTLCRCLFHFRLHIYAFTQRFSPCFYCHLTAGRRAVGSGATTPRVGARTPAGPDARETRRRRRGRCAQRAEQAEVARDRRRDAADAAPAAQQHGGESAGRALVNYETQKRKSARSCSEITVTVVVILCLIHMFISLLPARICSALFVSERS